VLDARPVEGRFRRLRWGANAILIAILFGVPWIRIGGEPLVLLDIPARQFHVFGLVIFPQELYFLWLIVIGLAIALFFFTALAGRLWCGWACPQTVFTDLFAAIARRVQGTRGYALPRDASRLRVVATHAIWMALCLAVGFHLVAYFHSPYALIGETLRGSPPAHSIAFVVVFSAAAYFDFAILRQTFCKYLCPYARFQSVLFDRDTLVVGYDTARGEPRGKRGHSHGDCVDCELCVKVCPTGIDIREGLQLECIACTQCIDACNGVMSKLSRPLDLIGYRSLASLEGGSSRGPWRPRVLAYGALLAAVAIAFVTLLERRLPMDLQVAHNSRTLYSTTEDGRISNAFTLRIENRDRDAKSFRIRVDDPAYELVTGLNPVEVPATSAVETRVFVLAKPDPSRRDPVDPLRFVLEPADGSSRPIVRRTHFVAPGARDGS